MVVTSGPGGKNGFPWSYCNLQNYSSIITLKTKQLISLMLRPSQLYYHFSPPHCHHFLTFQSFSPHFCKSLESSLQPPSPSPCHRFRSKRNTFPIVCFQAMSNNTLLHAIVTIHCQGKILDPYHHSKCSSNNINNSDILLLSTFSMHDCT